MLLQVNPRTLNFKDVFKGESKTLPVTVTPRRGTKFEIANVESPGPYFEVQVVPESGIGHVLSNALVSARERMVEKFGSHDASADTQAETSAAKPGDLDADVENARTINVKLLSTTPIGRYQGKLKIHTDIEEKPMLELHVVANVVGNVKVVPKHHSFGSVKRGESKEATFRITTRGTNSVKITGVKTNTEYASAELSEFKPGSQYELKIGLKQTAPVGRLYGTITVHTTDQDQPEIKLRFYANVVE